MKLNKILHRASLELSLLFQSCRLVLHCVYSPWLYRPRLVVCGTARRHLEDMHYLRDGSLMCRRRLRECPATYVYIVDP